MIVSGKLSKRYISVTGWISAFLLFAALSFSGCTQLQKPEPEPFFAKTLPPPKQEFRWANGKTPRSFDPARAAAAPETDIVRTMFEGLTDLDSKTLKEIPAVAEKWTPSADFRTWTFTLRGDAKWSNGEPVTAEDFVRSWKRLAELGDKVSHKNLLRNIEGFPKNIRDEKTESPDARDFLNSIPQARGVPDLSTAPTPVEDTASNTAIQPPNKESPNVPTVPDSAEFGFYAEGKLTLKVSLIHPDKDFPKLAAHPMFRPVYGEGTEFESEKLNAAVITNGPFRISTLGPEGISLDRSEHYWDRDSVKLERVRFVPSLTAEKALDAYRIGNVDAVTNADFSPLAIKLLEPFEDFRRTTYSALNFYEFNTSKAPFDDRRVRRALAIAIERERLTDGETEGTTHPANSFMPFGTRTGARLIQDKEKARDLLSEAGFPDGKGFPVIRLLINRNETQQRIARSVARMWKQSLNLNTEIIVKDSAELEALKTAGEYDAIRRGIVLPTADETANFMTIFHTDGHASEYENSSSDETKALSQSERDDSESGVQESNRPAFSKGDEGSAILSEEEALYELRAIPLYFPTSYSLVKPYVSGFDANSLDAPSLRDVVIDNNWQPK